MDQSSIYKIPAGADLLHTAARETTLPDALMEPMQALVRAVTRRAGEGPLSIYICAPDGHSGARDDVVRLLARALAAHVPSALVVDCDFLNTGLHGLVPQKDALGFLDFLLYGSSIGVITQESEGVRVVSAGSFPVSRRMPFVESAFDEAERRLAAHARCVIFAGPMTVEGGEPHPLTAEVDAVAVVVPGDDARAMETVDRVAERAHQVWAIQLGAPAPQPVAAASADAHPDPAATVVLPPPVLPTGVPPRPARGQEARYSSVLPRIAIIVFGVVVIAFAAWWFMQDHGTDEAGSEGGMPATKTAQTTAPAVLPADTMATAVLDTAAVTSARADSTPKFVPPPPVDPADTGGRTGGTQLVSSADIHVMADLEAKWKDWYMIHISSFQESVRAREEVDFLQSREFPVFIVYLDLGPKGKWYRVYCGPFQSRDEAREVKKNLDAVPQVRFTRIAKIPE